MKKLKSKAGEKSRRPKRDLKVKQKLDNKPEGYVFGRPTLYRPEYCAKIRSHAKKLGGTITSFAAKLEVPRETLYEWARKHRDFSDSMKVAKLTQESLMEDFAVKHLGRSRNFSAATWIFMMKARYGWREENQPDELEEQELEFVE